MFDRRVNTFITLEAFLFSAKFDDGLSTEVQVNPEFLSPEAAAFPATKYATEIGRIPTALRADMQTMWIQLGNELCGGGNNNVLIHTRKADAYEDDGILHETFLHEAAHTSIDAALGRTCAVKNFSQQILYRREASMRFNPHKFGVDC